MHTFAARSKPTGRCPTVPSREPVARGEGGQPLPFFEAIQRSFGRHDVSGARGHLGPGAAARALAFGAEAYTRGADIAFARSPSLFTAAHEAAHVVQQRGATSTAGGTGEEGDAHERHADRVAERVVRGQGSEDLLDAAPRDGVPALQMRRIPTNVRALLTAAGSSTPNLAANAAGVERLIDRTLAELLPWERASVLAARRGTLSQADFDALPPGERLSRTAEATLTLFPGFRLEDARLLDTPPRPHPAQDIPNIATLVARADAVLAAIVGGAHDRSIDQVFGRASRDVAKARYHRAKAAMNRIHRAGRIVADRSGFTAEVNEGGLTTFRGPIRLYPRAIDNPTETASIIVLIHESMHAGNRAVRDDLSMNDTGFQTQAPRQKLDNAAHYEVVAWRILDPESDSAFAIDPHATPPTFETFVPAGTSTTAGVAAPARTVAEEGAVSATAALRRAWAHGLNLQRLYLQLLRRPTDWAVPQRALDGRRFDGSLPFWSKVQKLTIHEKSSIDPASPDPARHPVTEIDMALAEGVTRKLDLAKRGVEVLDTDADVLAFEARYADPPEINAVFPGGAHSNVRTERDFLVRLAVRQASVAPITGPESRDVRVVERMADPRLRLWRNVLAPRDPNSFPD